MSLLPHKVNTGYDLHKSSPKINHLSYMDNLKLFGNIEKELDSLIYTVDIYSKDISMEFGLIVSVGF